MFDFENRRLKPMPPRLYGAPYDRAPRRVGLALVYAAFCHGLFGLAALIMVAAMYFGMSRSLGPYAAPWSLVANFALVAQFAVSHSVLLTKRGQAVLKRLAPAEIAGDMVTTTYVIVAAVQLGSLFALWSPSGIIWWQADGAMLWVMTALYASAWALLGKATWDSGIEIQSGLLGWSSVARGVKPVYPDMPEKGLFKYSRQPIYSSFALTLWTVPVWTPDQLCLAIVLTAYCFFGPMLKERRMQRFFGARFEAYRQRVPYWLPRF